MKFHNYESIWSIYKNKLKGELDRESMYATEIAHEENPLGGRHILFEARYTKSGEPYYDVYPCVIGLLKKLNLEKTSGSSIRPPCGIKDLVLRFPEGQQELLVVGNPVRCIWISFQRCRSSPIGEPKIVDGFVMGIDWGESRFGCAVWTIRVFPLLDSPVSETIGILETHKSMHEGIPVEEKDINECMRLAMMVCLIGEDESILEPLPLSKDEHRYSEADAAERKRLIEKAKRKGKIAFALGRSLEVIPHYRRPHAALYHTGKGRTETKIVFRSGSIVHREKIKEVPTGYSETN